MKMCMNRLCGGGLAVAGASFLAGGCIYYRREEVDYTS